MASNPGKNPLVLRTIAADRLKSGDGGLFSRGVLVDENHHLDIFLEGEANFVFSSIHLLFFLFCEALLPHWLLAQYKPCAPVCQIVC